MDAMELGIIAVVAIVIFLWGPSKIPELARGLGRAKKEFDMASKEFTTATMSGGATSGAPIAVERSADQVLVDTARQLGVDTAGKTRDQISQEIVAASKKS
jgi:sec-independent protein translocase protein TatA